MDSRSHLGANRRHSSAMARLSAAAPNPPARVWTARRGCACGAAAPCKGCNNGVGVKTRFHVSIFLGRGTSVLAASLDGFAWWKLSGVARPYRRRGRTTRSRRNKCRTRGAAMTAQNGSSGWVFDMAGLHRQGARCAQRVEGLVLGVPPPSFAMAHCHENRILRQRSSAKRLNGAPEPELQTYNTL